MTTPITGASHIGKTPLEPIRFVFDKKRPERLSHYLFRYPAKFHPPVARALIERFSTPEQTVLDPFCGSGTLLVEALCLGRNSIGLDIDPIATFVSRIKTTRVSPEPLQRSAKSLLDRLLQHERPETDYQSLMFNDIDAKHLFELVRDKDICLPAIPNIFHWFRRYVVLDLAIIRREIATADIPERHRNFFLLCFVAIIRNASNADPVPVSGLEVTSHMLKKEMKGRLVNPFQLYRRKLARSLDDLCEFHRATATSHSSASVRLGDATTLRTHVRTQVDVVITSPPYHNAVDYYRRHTLEMYWLNLIADHQERLTLRRKYIGRQNVPRSHPLVSGHALASSLAKKWEQKMIEHDQRRAVDFKHYVLSMTKSISGIARSLKRGGKAVFVVGKNTWNGHEIPTVELFDEIAGDHFTLVDRYWYPLKNRYMTYARHNNASIDKEYVLVYEKN